jgi:hypothetical protein
VGPVGLHEVKDFVEVSIVGVHPCKGAIRISQE